MPTRNFKKKLLKKKEENKKEIVNVDDDYDKIDLDWVD